MTLTQETPAPISIEAVPQSTSTLAWQVAAAWCGVPVTQLQSDTSPVKGAHYMAALQVLRVVEDWLRIRGGDEDGAAAVRAEREVSVNNPMHAEVSGALEAADDDSFIRVMMLAEEMGMLTAGARNRGDAATAVKYSGFEHSLLQVAAGLQTDDIEAGQ